MLIVCGLPGSGKSTLADALGRELGAAVLSVDPVEAAMWRSGIAPSFETGVAAYEVVAVLAEHQLRLGVTVIADAVSSSEVARDMWREAAARAGHLMKVVEVVCSDENVHQERLASRQRCIEGLPEPTWAEVQQRREEWEAWPEERLVLDSIQDPEENMSRAVAFLR